jgi:aminoglycoside phosphotransferase (APT) family kinase protein
VEGAEFGWLEQALGQSIGEAEPAAWDVAWDVRNRTYLAKLADGSAVVVQRHRLRADAERRVQVMDALREPAADKQIVIPRIRAQGLDANPPWIVFDRLPGVPVSNSDQIAPGSSRFPVLAWAMGALLAEFSGLSCGDLDLDDAWARPRYLAARADAWLECLQPALTPVQVRRLEILLAAVPALFDGRPAVLAHGDFAPVGILVDGETITGLLDFGSVRLADPLFDVACWAWSVRSAGTAAFASAWPAFLDGAEIDPDEPGLVERIRLLQVIRMVEMLADYDLRPDIWKSVHERLAKFLR